MGGTIGRKFILVNLLLPNPLPPSTLTSKVNGPLLYLCLECWNYHYLVFFVSHLVAMSTTCYNPVLYAWCNQDIRKEFSTLWYKIMLR